MDEYIKRSDMRAVLEKASISPRFADEPPAADVEPVRHGRWDDSFDGITPYCSVCGRSHSMLSNRTPPYCPNCGAHMDGEVAEDG